MPFKKEEHDQLLVELVDDKTSEGRKSIIAHELRKDFEDTAKWMEENGKKVDSLKAEHDVLLEANLRLLKAGNSFQEKTPEKTFSQKITITDMENRHRVF